MKGLTNNLKLVKIGMFIIFVIGILCIIFFSVVKGKNNNDDNYIVSSDMYNGSGELVGRDESSKSGDSSVVGKSENSELQNKEIYVHIIGEIKNPGVIILTKGSRIIDAIDKAGGATENADLSKINLAYILSDGQKVEIPSVYSDDRNGQVEYVTNEPGNNVIQGAETKNAKVNINTASQTELETISGIGPSLAGKIIKYREKNGKFKRIIELKNVSGIGDAKYEEIKDFVDV